MNFLKIDPCDTINTLEGVSVTLWVAGCPHHCDGCHNAESWNKDAGMEFDYKAMANLLALMSDKYVTSFTLLGGEPFAPYNANAVLNIARIIKEWYPDKKIYVWTGYCLEYIAELYDLDNIDYIIDGEYRKDLPTKKKLRGSDNQRLWRNKNRRWRVVD